MWLALAVLKCVGSALLQRVSGIRYQRGYITSVRQDTEKGLVKARQSIFPVYRWNAVSQKAASNSLSKLPLYAQGMLCTTAPQTKGTVFSATSRRTEKVPVACMSEAQRQVTGIRSWGSPAGGGSKGIAGSRFISSCRSHLIGRILLCASLRLGSGFQQKEKAS